MMNERVAGELGVKELLGSRQLVLGIDHDSRHGSDSHIDGLDNLVSLQLHLA